uniref:CARD domain-containing protein n=1 Tax=Xiphophorus couchianus TaxID=32473 RepID=A0A3B5M5A2_9TELE
MEGVSEDDLCWLQLDDFRMLLIKTIDPSRITPYLRQCQVISAEDEEQLFNDPALVIRRRKVGALLDMLQRTGMKGYTAFLESLELDYPQLYSRITGKEPNKTFSILIDTAGESGLTQFLMSELSRLQRVCAVQEAWSRQQKLKERELKKLTERVQKLREEREQLTEELKKLRLHNYNLMADVTSLTQDKSNALLANRDLQIESIFQSRILTPPSDAFLQLNDQEEQQEAPPPGKQQEELQEEKKPDRREELKEGQRLGRASPQMNLLTTVFRLRRELHKGPDRSVCLFQSVEEKEELSLRCAQLKGDAKMYRQQSKQTVRQLEEVIRERDKAQQQEEARLHLQEKDRYRERVRQLAEKTDKLELLLLRSQGEELQLRTRLRKMTFNSQQVGGGSEEVPSGTSGENEEPAAPPQEHGPPAGGPRESDHRPNNVASWVTLL